MIIVPDSTGSVVLPLNFKAHSNTKKRTTNHNYSLSKDIPDENPNKKLHIVLACLGLLYTCCLLYDVGFT